MERVDAGQTTGVSEPVRYLSLGWLNELSAAVAAHDELQRLATEHTIGVTQVVSDGPEGDVTYHLQVGGGTATFGPGPADPEDVLMEQSWDTAVAVATGTMNAQDAFVNGHIRMAGDQHKLLASQAVFGQLDAVFQDVRTRTSYH